MKPRYVTVLLMIVLGAMIAPLVANAQAPTKVARIGWMSRGNPTASDAAMDAFRQGMRELGYVEGQTFVMEPRYGGGKRELMSEQAAELERAGVDVIIAGPFEALQAAKQSTSRVPIIMTPSADPVATGIVKSLDRPGGTITGITEMMPELTPQRLTLLKQIVPTLHRVAILWQPGTLSEDAFTRLLQETQATARAIGVHIQVVEAAKVEDFDTAFSAMAKERAEGLIVLVNPMFSVQRQHIIERAAKQGLPAIDEWRPFVRSGGLISYGADVLDVYRRAAAFVDKILKGAKPGDLPVERPTRVDMAVNLKAAKALGVTIPKSIVKQAVEVIEAASPVVAQALDVEKLYGTWKLVSFTQRIVATGETIDVFGRSPSGFLSYSRDGRMNAILVKDKRPRPADMAQATTEDKAQLFSSMYAYAGTFTVDGKTVTHHIDISWNENWTGTHQVRNVRLDGDRLYISTNPQSNGIDGKIIVGELVWEKVK